MNDDVKARDQALLKREIVRVLFDIPPCPDGEAGRACRWCEAEALAQWWVTRG